MNKKASVVTIKWIIVAMIAVMELSSLANALIGFDGEIAFLPGASPILVWVLQRYLRYGYFILPVLLLWCFHLSVLYIKFENRIASLLIALYCALDLGYLWVWEKGSAVDVVCVGGWNVVLVSILIAYIYALTCKKRSTFSSA